MKNILNKYWPLILILGLTLLVAWPIFLPGYFSHHDDLQVMRIFEMKKCLEDFQIPCRWVPDLGYGNGYPLFNYYNVFPYYIGGFASFVLGYINSAKLLFLIATLLAPVSMYFLAKELFGRYPAIVSAILYSFAPYRALDIYVRGAVSESFAIAIIPLVFYFGLKSLKENNLKNYIFLSLSFASFLTSHNIMTLLFSPVIVLFFITILWKKSLKDLKKIIIFLLLGMGISAFFLLPAFLEKNLVQIDNLTKLELDFRAHFVTVPQLFLDRSWGYGASSPGLDDTISFQIGFLHWVLVFATTPFLFLIWKKDQKLFFISVGLLIMFLFSIFMTHNKSAFIWEKIGILRFTQFPWRFLSVTIFVSSLFTASLIYILKNPWQKLAVVALVPLIIFLNFNYFKPKEFYPKITDKNKLTGKLWEIQQKASILDYLPMTSVEPREAAPAKPTIVTGEVEIKDFKNRSNKWELKIDVKSQSTVEIPVLDFPNWQVFLDGKKINHSNKNYLGRISFDLLPGSYTVVGRFGNTPIRTLGNIISLVSLGSIVLLIAYGKIRKTNK